VARSGSFECPHDDRANDKERLAAARPAEEAGIASIAGKNMIRRELAGGERKRSCYFALARFAIASATASLVDRAGTTEGRCSVGHGNTRGSRPGGKRQSNGSRLIRASTFTSDDFACDR
jgi:hypothetical protein